MKYSCKKKYQQSSFIFLANILEKLRLLSYFQEIKYFMANQNLFLNLK